MLDAIFFLVGRDEAAHAAFTGRSSSWKLRDNREETIADLAYVLASFKMPGDGLIPNYRERLETSGAGISPRVFLQKVAWPLISAKEISRDEMMTALRKHKIARAL